MNKTMSAYGISIALFAISIALAVSIGSVYIPLETLWEAASPQGDKSILWQIRLPRVVLAGLVGAALAIAGASFQGLFKNPLADPYTLGLSSGASVGAVATLFFSIQLPFVGIFTLPIMSMIGALVTILFVMIFARLVDPQMKMETLVLTGIIVSSFLGSVMSLMIALTGDELRQIIGWLLGSVSMRGWSYVQMAAPFILAGSIALLFVRRDLNAMLFGEERAHHLGVSVKNSKLIVLVAGSVVTGTAVAVSGTIGFVGLVVPHIVRLVVGSDHRAILPLSILNGATLLILCDLLARTIIAPTELPIGVITAFLGAPLFAFIFFQSRRKGNV